jgi:hypothetical protein
MLNIVSLKSSKIFFNEKISFLIIKKKKFLLIKSSNFIKFFLISDFVFCFILNNTLFVESSNIALFNVFIKSLLDFKKILSIKSKKKLRVNGLGFRLNLLPGVLNLKLGFSHSIDVLVPADIVLSVKKNILVADSFNKINLGNFLCKVRGLKIPDVYKGKGFWYASEKESLKQIKKK